MKDKKPMGFEIKGMDHVIKRHLNDRLAAAGFDEVTIMHGWIMGYIYRNSDREIYQKDIENNFHIARSSVTNIIKLMEKKGYVTRTTVERDARLKRLELTELGMKMQLETIRIIDGFNADMETGITNEEKEVFYRILDKMKSNIENKKEDK